MKKETFVSAALISTVGLILTRIISVIYTIPFTSMMNENALIINNYAYTMFNQFYELSLAGLPLAVSRLIAMYNAKEEYHTSNKILRYAQIIMLSLGAILGISFFLFAKPFAIYQLRDGNINLANDLVNTMRIIAPSLFLLPFMSGMRGYLQGFKTVVGTSISQVVERLVFVIVLLAGLYFGIYYFHLDAVIAISYAYIALPIASLAAIFVLLPFYKNIRKEHQALMKSENGTMGYDKKYLLQQIITTALPFVIAGLASTMYASITTLTYEKIRLFAHADPILAQLEYNTVIYYTNKLVSIPLTFSLAMSTSIISFITSAFEGKNHREVKNYVNRSYRIIIFSTLGSVILMALLGKPLLVFFYGDKGYLDFMAGVLTLDGFRGMCFALETITISIMQSIGKKNRAVLYTSLGPVVKLLLSFPLVYFFGIYGEILSIILGLFFVITLATRKIIEITGIRVQTIFNALIKTIICMLPTIVFVILTNTLVDNFYPTIYESRILSILYLGITGLIGFGMFLYVAEITGFLQVVFGKGASLKALVNRYLKKEGSE